MLRGRKCLVACALIVGFGVLAAQGHAGVTYSAYSETAYPVTAAGDLLLGKTPIAISGTGDQEGLDSSTSGAALTTGATAPDNPYIPGGSSSMTIMNNGAYVIYGTSGDTINEVVTFSGWQDGGRSQQQYQLLGSNTLAGFPGSWTTLATVNAPTDPYGGPYPPDNKPSDGQVVITSLNDSFKYLAFYFPSTENGYVGYTQLTAYGTPEPASLAIWGVVIAGGLLVARRRKSG